MIKSTSWAIYDHLIKSIPDDIVVKDCLVGLHWILLRSEGVGLAMTPPDSRTVNMAGSIRGMKVHELAQRCKSWDFMEASIAMAAINSVTNTLKSLERHFGSALSSGPDKNVFDYLLPRIEGKKVAVIGHFPGLEQIASVSQLSILERRPHQGDFPDSACEYLLPEQDFIVLSGTTLANKTLPRLLSLGQRAYIVVVGPTTTLHPVLFEHGVSLLAGTVIDDDESVWIHAAEGGTRSIFDHGARMVNLVRQ